MKLLLIGAGAMGQAILRGWCDCADGAASELSGEDFIVVDPSEEKCASLSNSLGVHAMTDIANLNDEDIDAVILAVKPQVLPDVLEQLALLPHFAEDLSENEMPILISIAAGIPTATIEERFPEGIKVVRVMPNMPLQVAQGASAVAGGANTTDDHVQLVCELFGCLGYAAIVHEDAIDAICAISGGGPAYVAKFIEDLTAAGVEAGLDASLAEQLAIATTRGSVAILDQGGVSPEELRVSVCSPGGTTLAALAAMDEGGFSESIHSGVAAAIARAKEMASC